MLVYFSGGDQSVVIVYSRLKFEQQACSMHHEWCSILFLLLHFSSTKQAINQNPIRITDPTLVISHQNKNIPNMQAK